MSKSEPRWYGVSTGDGNNGVSHMFPDYYVFTDDPWELAKRAAKCALKPDVEFEVDGDSEYGVNAVVYDDPSFYDDYDEDADYSDWESGPCPFILEVFPLDDASNGRAPMYGGISEALGEDNEVSDARLRFDEAKSEASEIRKTALRLIAEFKFADSWSRLDGPLPPTIRKTLCATIQGYRESMCELYEQRASLLADYGQHEAWNH